MKEAIKLFKILLDTIDGLSEEELSALLSGKAHLKIEPSGEQKSNESVYVIPNDFLTQLESCDSRESAQKLFNESNFSKGTLKTVAKHYSIPIGSKDTNSQLISKIIEIVIGSKLKYDTLLNTNLNGSN